MDFGSILGMASGLSLAIERAMEAVKIGYLKIKNVIFPKLNYTEITVNEKIILTIGTSIAAIFIGGSALVLPIPGVLSLPLWLQQVITGLIISMGSGILHTAFVIFKSIKDNIESASNS